VLEEYFLDFGLDFNFMTDGEASPDEHEIDEEGVGDDDDFLEIDLVFGLFCFYLFFCILHFLVIFLFME
jgi:hypothetical protein